MKILDCIKNLWRYQEDNILSCQAIALYNFLLSEFKDGTDSICNYNGMTINRMKNGIGENTIDSYIEELQNSGLIDFGILLDSYEFGQVYPEIEFKEW